MEREEPRSRIRNFFDFGKMITNYLPNQKHVTRFGSLLKRKRKQTTNHQPEERIRKAELCDVDLPKESEWSEEFPDVRISGKCGDGRVLELSPQVSGSESDMNAVIADFKLSGSPEMKTKKRRGQSFKRSCKFV